MTDLQMGDRAHVVLYTDIKPCTVIHRTPRSVTVRYDKAEMAFTPEWIPGGFSAICTNDHQQKWTITEDPEGATETFRWHKNDGCFVHNGCRLYPGWRKYYDFNF